MMDNQTDRPLTARLRQELEAACGGNERQLFALFDAARIYGLRALLQALQFEFVSLYAGSAEQDLAHRSPYLTRLPWREETFVWFEQLPVALESAVFCVASGELSELRNHFRRFLLVVDAQGRDVYLRFYDPRVLAPFLSACNDEEQRQFFGPVQRLMVRDSLDAKLSRKPAVRSWAAPAGAAPSEAPLRRPGAATKFTLRPEHEAAFGRDALERYEQSAGGYLRERFPQRLGSAPEQQVRAYLRSVREFAPTVGIVAGRDVTLLAEVLVLRDEDSVRSHLSRFAPADRSRELWVLRDQVVAASGEMT